MDINTIDTLASRTESPTPLGNISKGSSPKPMYPTRCVHTISQDDNSVLSLAASDTYLFSGSQSSRIHVWDLQNFSLVTSLVGHRGSVLALTLSPDQRLLFSCSGDGTIRVWDTATLRCVYLIQSCHDVGDIFSMVYSATANMLIFGNQNTSIQWFDLTDPQTNGSAGNVPVIPINPRSSASQKSKFFGAPSYEDIVEEVDRFPTEEYLVKCVIREKNVRSNAHDGYVYCLLHAVDIPNVDGEVVLSGSGDGDVKIWSISNSTLKLLNTLRGDTDKGVLSMAISEDGYLFCGVQGGDVQIWDLETNQLIRSMMAHSDDVLAVAIRGPGFVSASADGTIKVWNEEFEFRECMDDHDGIVLSMICSQDYLITGSSDHSIKFWDMPSPVKPVEHFRRNSIVQDAPSSDTLLYVLDKWISMRTVSGSPKCMEECRRGARFLKNVLQQLGAVSRMIPGITGRNPLVYGRFSARRTSNAGITAESKVPTVLVYGHYDVIAAQNDKQQWNTDPFKLTGKNGYLYGRGTSDNKGPVLASIFAVYELLKEGQLDVNVIFLVEGEEENGSLGFQDAVNKYKDLFADVDLILLSNSYWLGEDVPCITYGLRGVIHASIKISNTLSDLHSGVEGGAVSEPLIDLIHVTGRLVDNNKHVLVPGFYDDVSQVTDAEKRLYDPIVTWLQTSETALSQSRTQHSAITSPTLSDKSKTDSDSPCSDKRPNIRPTQYPLDTDRLKQELMARWRFPTLSVHKIDVSISNRTIIPRCATACVSMRIVPDQSIEDIAAKFEDYVRQVFADMNSENEISVEIQSSAEYWLGNPESRYFKAVEKAIHKEWNMKPLYIREGGSIPAVRFLEKFCNAPAVHLPMGQASDQAHLHNERIRLRNLHAGRRIIKSLLQDLAASSDT
ncbi:WD40-repeat-containing domain protein [Zychaea mexicana]|uniref:WD40-repeat-containing domain protein n=1 Tax=Zychaea mexicana TaxID=64656 RepID=UPI0022FE3AC4|nr:WD40-repeat-containing domain protein [Zychaea mexicana]KAI9489794.1 WD40-repeat-containing domain protein [Zychaea mexicana]